MCGEKTEIEDGFISLKRDLKNRIKRKNELEYNLKRLKEKNDKLYEINLELIKELIKMKECNIFRNYVFVEDLICFEELVSENDILKIDKLNV